MKSDLNALMRARNLDALMVLGGEGYSDARYYLSNGAQITGGIIVKKTGEEPLLIVSEMEIEEAKQSGHRTMTYSDFDSPSFNYLSGDALVQLWVKALKAAGVESGRVGLYGSGDINEYIVLFQIASQSIAQYEFVGEAGRTIFKEAFLTKEADEIERVKSVAERTNAAVAATWEFIASHRANEDELVIKDDGTPLSIGDVKAFVRRELIERGLEDKGMIFAQGRDAGFPHSRGEAEMPLKLGQSIVFDVFPCEMGGGYHHDMTRTWCIAYAPPEVQQAYDEVREAFDIALENFGIGMPTHLMQEAVQDYFEGKGHITARGEQGTQVGYVHSLGHGVGLAVHEKPSISHLLQDDVFQAGNIITIEPGLYYPEKGYGVRVEDLFFITDNGELVSLSSFKKDLVLPLNSA